MSEQIRIVVAGSERQVGAGTTAADMFEDRPGEWRRLGNIGVDPRVAAHRMPPPSISRITPTTMTNRLRLRPALLLDAIPTAAPIRASGIISQ